MTTTEPIQATLSIQVAERELEPRSVYVVTARRRKGGESALFVPPVVGMQDRKSESLSWAVSKAGQLDNTIWTRIRVHELKA